MVTPINNRSFSQYTDDKAKIALNRLLEDQINPDEYRAVMKQLGCFLGHVLSPFIPKTDKCLVVSTAEDADYLSRGVLDSLKEDHEAKTAVFWNNHYLLKDGVSVAPIVHKFLEPGYDKSNQLIIVKSVISGSCVVRTNLLEVIEKIKAKNIYIVSPVMHKNSEASLLKEFPSRISKKFKFIYFAVDAEKDTHSGEVIPGIGGQIYDKLGLGMQPVKTGFIPELVKELTQYH
ncbi:hypothetical protein PSI19_07670 [Xenorhabdus khoisanae]|uniref:hypothetical protein n=1 Tax=Xenorhabdus khoisanae TaxID=880157 RepID=UPI002359DFAF|nr:hypothetical protein [Xenorhabdus khoisanae]MDC9613767.1 hypothetical protein [Xenorhabdus khoisanae]